MLIFFTVNEIDKDALVGHDGCLPRKDFRETLELTLILLGECLLRGASFQIPGAFHHAR